MRQGFKWTVILALVVFIAVPAATMAFHFGVAALSILMNRGPTERQKEMQAVSEKYRHVHRPKNGADVLLTIDRFGDFVPTRLASVQLVFKEGRFGGGTLSERTRAARIAAPKYAQAECQALLKTLASQCRLSEATVSAIRDVLEIRLSLHFVQKGDFGEAPATAEAQLDIAPLSYPAEDNLSARLRSESEAASSRSEIYAAIAKDCGATRSAYGNCAIYRIQIRSDPVGSAGKKRILTSGAATLASISPVESPSS